MTSSTNRHIPEPAEASQEASQSELTSTTSVEVSRVQRNFGETEVLSGVDFTVEANQVHGLIGPNGVGKTTLLRILAGLVQPSSGSVRVLGDSPYRDSVRRRIGWIPGGDRTFYLRLSGFENLLFFGRMYGLTTKEAKNRSTHLLAEVGLAEAAHRSSALYSKGMLKRLSVARALLASPEVLLCDETTHDLDPEGAQDIREMIRRLADTGVATVWATQRLDELAGFADSVTVLSKQGVAFSGEMGDLLDRLEARTFVLRCGDTDASNAAEALARVPGIVYHVDGSSLVVTVPHGETMGSVVGALTSRGITVTSANELGSEVEAAYRSVLGKDSR